MLDTVYHVTTSDRAVRCLAEGLQPYKTTLCAAETRAHDRHYDSMRPDHIVRIGLCRARSVYAHPDLDVAATRRNGGWLNRVQSGIAILALRVDPRSVFVADALLTSLPHIPPEYWASVATLQQYRGQERPQFLAPNWAENNEDRPDKWRSYVYLWPEVLIPDGVEASAVSLVSVIEPEPDGDSTSVVSSKLVS